MKDAPIPEHTPSRIFMARGRRVILDSDLAELYGVPTKRLNQQVRRNSDAFTEHGALMAATVLNSGRAIEMSIYLVRTFIAMREEVANNRELARRLEQLKERLEGRLDRHDKAIEEILAAIKALMNPPMTRRRPIGYVAPKDSPNDA